MENKKIVEIEFEDHGQDFLVWKIEMKAFNYGKVIDSQPFQAGTWTQYYVLNEPVVGEKIRISQSPEHEVITIKYPIIAIKEIADEVN